SPAGGLELARPPPTRSDRRRRLASWTRPSPRSVRFGADDLPARDDPRCAPDHALDGALDEPDRAAVHQRVDPPWGVSRQWLRNSSGDDPVAMGRAVRRDRLDDPDRRPRRAAADGQEVIGNPRQQAVRHPGCGQPPRDLPTIAESEQLTIGAAGIQLATDL